MNSGYDVKMKLTGDFRAGGSAAAFIKFGDRVYTADAGKGKADVLISLERLECARMVPQLKLGAPVFTSLTRIMPKCLEESGEPYPDEIFENLAMLGIEAVACDTDAICRMCENSHAAGAVLIGIAGDMLLLSRESIRNAINDCLPEEAAKSTLKAYDISLTMNRN